MSSTVRGFSVRDLTQHAKAELGNINVNFGKALPATTTGSIFTVTGVIAVTGLVGVVSTVFGVTTVKISLGVTGKNSAIAAVPASGYASTAVGSAIIAPTVAGGPLPAAVVASATVKSSGFFTVSNTAITMTTDATNTGNITWLLSWVPLFPKGASVAVVNN